MSIYLFPLATLVYGFLVLVKDWADHKNSKLKTVAYVGYVAIGILNLMAVHNAQIGQVRKDADNLFTKSQLEQANNSLREMSKTIMDLKADVKSEQLQHRILSLEDKLEKTRTALAPGPKAEVSFSLSEVPSVGKFSEDQIRLIVDRLLNSDGSVDFDLQAINISPVNADDVLVNLTICNGCTYKSAPKEFKKFDRSDEKLRIAVLGMLHSNTKTFPLSFSVFPARGSKAFTIGISYKCNSCTNDKKIITGRVNIVSNDKPKQ